MIEDNKVNEYKIDEYQLFFLINKFNELFKSKLKEKIKLNLKRGNNNSKRLLLDLVKFEHIMEILHCTYYNDRNFLIFKDNSEFDLNFNQKNNYIEYIKKKREFNEGDYSSYLTNEKELSIGNYNSKELINMYSRFTDLNVKSGNYVLSFKLYLTDLASLRNKIIHSDKNDYINKINGHNFKIIEHMPLTRLHKEINWGDNIKKILVNKFNDNLIVFIIFSYLYYTILDKSEEKEENLDLIFLLKKGESEENFYKFIDNILIK